MRIQLFLVLTALTGLAFLAANAVPSASAATPVTNTKGKAAPAPKAKAKAVAPAKGTAKGNAAASKAPAPAAKKQGYAVATKGKAPSSVATRRPAASQAVYSRSNSRTYTRSTPAVRRTTTPVRSTPNYWQSRPTEDRYREIQQSLADKGFYKGEVNGTWSAESVEALKNFQRAQNLDPDGKLGSLSLIAMGLGPKRIAANTTPANTAVPAVPPPTPLPSTLPPNPARP